jgi:hypothetical protein
MSTAARAKITMNLCSEHQLPKIDFKHHTRKLQDSLIDMSDALSRMKYPAAYNSELINDTDIFFEFEKDLLGTGILPQLRVNSFFAGAILRSNSRTNATSSKPSPAASDNNQHQTLRSLFQDRLPH